VTAVSGYVTANFNTRDDEITVQNYKISFDFPMFSKRVTTGGRSVLHGESTTLASIEKSLFGVQRTPIQGTPMLAAFQRNVTRKIDFTDKQSFLRGLRTYREENGNKPFVFVCNS